MPCKLCEEKLLEYLYGELGEEDRRLMESHLQSSPPCREVLAGYREVRASVATLREEETPPGLRTRLKAHAEEALGRRTTRAPRAWLFKPAMATVSVAALAALVYVYSVRTTGEISPYKAAPPALETYRSPMAGEVQEFQSPYDLKDLQDPDAEREAFVRRDTEAKREATAPVIKEARRAPDAPPLGRSGGVPAGAQGLTVPPARNRPGQGIPEPAEEGAGSFKSLAAVPPPAAEPIAPAAPGSGPASQAAPEADEAAPGGAATGPERSVPGARRAYRTAAAPREIEPRELLEEESDRAPLERIAQLTGEDRCSEARIWVYIYRVRHAREPETGRAWMDVAHCFQRKGAVKEAVEAAREALKVPAAEAEAKTFLQSMPHPGMDPDPPDSVPAD